jgi:prolyl-tRNA editing enzyme YbaK/EbsC (Cys-tRNA(Pro) deacylase)
MTTAPRLNPHQIRVAAYYWRDHKLATSEIAEKLGVPEASVANSMDAIRTTRQMPAALSNGHSQRSGLAEGFK